MLKTQTRAAISSLKIPLPLIRFLGLCQSQTHCGDDVRAVLATEWELVTATNIN